jgi:formylglycine-generating enzyme required for sulfatase activity/class 3 adenylate cyclase
VAPSSTRRLAAILAADISGYGRLVAADEKGTIARVRRIMRELVEPTIAEHRGTFVKTMGDGALAIFDSPVEAVRCAIVLQQSMVSHNLELPRDQWVQFRIGVNLGDVLVEEEDIFGEGVNIAARLEQMANPGGIYISGAIYEQIKSKLVCGYQSLGDRKVKNITDPVPIYRVLPDPMAFAKARRRQSWRTVVPILALVLIGGIGGAWYLWRPQAGELTGTIANSATSSPSPPEVHASLEETRPPASGTSPPSPPDAKDRPAEENAQPAAPSQTQAPDRKPPEQPTTPENTAAPPPAPQSGTSEAPRPQEKQQAALLPPPPPPAQSLKPAFDEPQMVLISGGTFKMGSNDDPSERPIHAVTVRPFWLAKTPVTANQWGACVAAHACSKTARGDDDRPVSNVSWDDAKQYANWLSQQSGKSYRLPTEAEWEYAARGGTSTRYWWGNAIGTSMAECKGCGGAYDAKRPLKVASFRPNGFGLYDMAGGVAEWVSDCWHPDYRGAPKDGSSWEAPDCGDHLLRGGSWRDDPSALRASNREEYEADVRYPTHGFRVARDE